LIHISRLADRFIRDPHEVVGVGDVLKVWVVDVDKTRRRVSLTAIAPGSQRQHRPPRERKPQQRPPRPPRRQEGDRPPSQATAAPAAVGAPAQPQRDRPPRPQGGGRRDQGRGGRQAHPSHPKTVERAPTKPKKFKPITKAQEEGKEPMRSFSDLLQLFDKKKKKPDASEDGEANSG
jgi:protein Tex